MKTDKSQRVKKLVEKIGVLTDKAGLQPAVGRVFAFLMVSDPPQKSFEDIQQYLGISKSSVSNALNVLMSREVVDYMTMPGDRKRYFQLAVSGWLSQTKKQMSIHSSMPELLQEVLAARSTNYPDFNKSLREAIEFYEFMEKETKAAIEKWEITKGKK